jgi:hypothetical protein
MRPTGELSTFTHSQWLAEGERLFGPDTSTWRFICPSCRYVASVADWRAAGASENAVAFACIGRYVGDPQASADAAFKGKGGPCNYTGGGLFGLNPVFVDFGDGSKPRPTFAFAPPALIPISVEAS